MSTSCAELGFNVPADKVTLDELNEKITSASDNLVQLAPRLANKEEPSE